MTIDWASFGIGFFCCFILVCAGLSFWSVAMGRDQ